MGLYLQAAMLEKEGLVGLADKLRLVDNPSTRDGVRFTPAERVALARRGVRLQAAPARLDVGNMGVNVPRALNPFLPDGVAFTPSGGGVNVADWRPGGQGYKTVPYIYEEGVLTYEDPYGTQPYGGNTVEVFADQAIKATMNLMWPMLGRMTVDELRDLYQRLTSLNVSHDYGEWDEFADFLGDIKAEIAKKATKPVGGGMPLQAGLLFASRDWKDSLTVWGARVALLSKGMTQLARKLLKYPADALIASLPLGPGELENIRRALAR